MIIDSKLPIEIQSLLEMGDPFMAMTLIHTSDIERADDIVCIQQCTKAA